MNRVENNNGKKFTTKLVKDFAKIKISKLPREVKICSIVPSSKSFFRNSALEKINENSKENQIIMLL